MQVPLRQYYAAAALSGLLCGIAFPPLPFGGLAFGAFVPLLWVLSASLPLRRLLTAGYLFGFCFHGVANWWVSSWQPEADPYLLVAGLLLWLGHPLFFLVPLTAAWWLAQRTSAQWMVVGFPFIWTGFEWLHSLGEIGYPWLSIGYTQVGNLYWIQVADLGGIWGASFLVLWANVALYRVLQLWGEARRQGLSLWQLIRQQQVWAWGALCGGVVVLPMLYGGLRLEGLRALQPTGVLRAVLVQPDFNPWAKWEQTAAEQVWLQQRLADSVLQRFKAELVVWNETAIPVPVTLPEYRWLWDALGAWVRQHGVALLSGFAEMQVYPVSKASPLARRLPWDSSRAYSAYNAAFLLTSFGELAGVHRKVRLTPFAERFPYAELFGGLTQLVEWGVGISAWAKGERQEVMKLPRAADTVTLGVAICIESIFPDFVRAYIQRGSDILVVLSNDAWFDGTPGPAQHFAIARVRAIETRRPILRCANSGITAAILPTGEVGGELPQYRATALPVTLPMYRVESLYASIGDVIPQAAMVWSLVLLALAAFRRAGVMKGNRRSSTAPVELSSRREGMRG
ncbi:MAG: apolipoprotein N-acyltransferase [Candidatus Kapabacteria bacterium]|nr:apolipoprotein N-acyltransferase [Candidatus Kapabacteria bacterium]MDW8011569.1 apolipoprotein N-acyltransferase [Bacteroidota bacterium]